MDMDAKHKRAMFIDKSSDIRDVFHFAHPEQILKAWQEYVSDAYGFMLYDLGSQASQSYLKSWNTFVKLAWNVPRSTYTYLVENVLADKFVPFRKQIFSRYVNFFQHLFTSCSKEIRHLARIVSRDARSVVWKNVELIKSLSGLSPWDYSSWRVVQKIENVPIPPGNEWRITLLVKLLNLRRQKATISENTSRLDSMINSLCDT